MSQIQLFLLLARLLDVRSIELAECQINHVDPCTNFDPFTDTLLGSQLCGDLITPIQETLYAEARTQYASISRPENILPSMILYAECDADIRLALEAARKCDYKVMTRSGGHQYSGLSSCNSTLHPCIQIDMSAYNEITYHARKNTLRIGAGVRVAELAAFLAERHLFLPHGDCKRIGLGGHIQTGGQGHIHNQFGSISDHITGFNIFLADGKEVQVRMPSNWQVNVMQTPEESSGPHPLNDMLYYAVLGASPGAFGIITTILFEPLKDREYAAPRPRFYFCDWPFHKDALLAMLKAMQSLHTAEFVLNNREYGAYLRLFKGTRGDIIRFMGSFVATSGEAYHAAYLEAIISAANAATATPMQCNPSWIAPSEYNRRVLEDDIYALHTFESRFQATILGLSDDFIQVFVARVDLLYTDPMYANGINLWADVVFAGGNAVFANPEKKRTVSGGTANLQVNTDLFYDESLNANGRQLSEEWISESWRQFLATVQYGFGQIDIRAQPLSFGNMNLTEVWQHYYKGCESFAALRQIKTTVDPKDIFSNIFTLKPLR